MLAFAQTYLLPCLWAFCACWGFCIIFNIHGAGIYICCAGGALGWFVYLITGPLVQNAVLQAFFAGLFISAWSEIMSRVRKCPVTGYLLVAFFPLVPGGGIYYAMEHAISGEMTLFAATMMHTMGFSGALAVGVLMVSSSVRMWNAARSRRRLKR